MCTHIESAIMYHVVKKTSFSKNCLPFSHFILQTCFLEEEDCLIFVHGERLLGASLFTKDLSLWGRTS
jgi:hypothetical protein